MLRPVSATELTGPLAEPRQPRAEALYTDQSWRPCTILSWGKTPAGWAARIRWPDGRVDWRLHDPQHLRAATAQRGR